MRFSASETEVNSMLGAVLYWGHTGVLLYYLGLTNINQYYNHQAKNFTMDTASKIIMQTIRDQIFFDSNNKIAKLPK